MAKMKVHELAKELDKQSKEILAFLQEKGIEAKAAQSSIEEEAIKLVKNHFGAKKETVSEPENKSVQNTDTKTEMKAAQAEEEAPKKKKKIIFVSNPQNSKMSGQRPNNNQARPNNNQSRPAGQGQRPYSGQNRSNNNPMRPAGGLIRPSIPPSPAPAVNMVPSNQARPAVKKAEPQTQTQDRPVQDRPVQDRPVQERPAYNNQAQSRERNGNDRPANTTQRPQDNRPAGRTDSRTGTGRTDNRPAGSNRPGERSGGYQQRYTGGDRGQNTRPDNRNGQGARPAGDNRPARDGRPGGSPYNQNGPRSAAPGQGGGRSYGNNGSRPTGPNAGQGNKFGNRPAPKGFQGETPVKDIEKHREDEKRRNISQDKDKRSRKDLIYEEDGSVKNKPGRFIKPEKKKDEQIEEVIKTIVLPEIITIKELAEKMKIQPSAIVKKLFLEGRVVTLNEEITYEDAENIAIEYDIICEKEVKVDVIEELLKEEEEKEEDMVSRAPVICVMGHVDHGKTSLLDAIRKTNVTDREAGGITQHIGAYTVQVKGQKITFLDTPGHEAFTAMRMRGANATDIAILVVAADDGVMPQTVEAINHAKAAGIEIIVAVNKVDKPNANIDKVKQELAEYELIPEDWGGSTVFAPVSAKSGEGIEPLLEMILLTAEILELKANPSRRARGIVIEAELDKGRGPVATVLVQKGTLKVGDFISAGASHGKVRAMIDDKGRRVKEAEPSTPVEILGLNDVPKAGEVFIAHENDKTAKSYAETFVSQNKERMLEDTKSRMSLDDLFTQIQAGNLKELNLIVKADVQGSVEAVKQSLMKLSNEEVIVKCIHGGVGAINESDVSLASASAAIIIGFNVRPDATAKTIAEREGVDVRLYKVIYQAIEDVEAAMKGMLDPVFEEKVIGHAEVRQIFKASAVGNIAGAYVLDGNFQRGCKVRVSREGEQIFEGELASLKRFKDDVKEVKAGYECGLVFDGFDQMQELDIVEAYIMVEVPR